MRVDRGTSRTAARRGALLLAAILLVLTLPGCGRNGSVTESPFGVALPPGVRLDGPRRIADGLELWRGHADIAFGLDPPTSRVQSLTLVRIDLRTPGVRFTSAPPGGPDEPARPGHQVVTTGRTVRDAMASRPDVRLAVNANFFWPCCEGSDAAQPPVGMSLFGLNVADRRVVSDPAAEQRKQGSGCAAQPAVPDAEATGSAALLIDGDNHARFAMQTATDVVPADLQAAVAGGPQPTAAPSSGCGVDDGYPPLPHVPGPPFLLQSGRIDATASNRPPEIVAGRTFVGLSSDGRWLSIATIDGGAGSGAAFYDEASWLLLTGSSDGLNLDGGGSTTLALNTTGLADPPPSPCHDDAIRLLDVPYGLATRTDAGRCTERLVGTYLGVIAPTA